MTDEEIERIKEDEQLRYNVRRELMAKGSTVWKYLNSGFVLWLLSSVVVGGIAFLYSRYTSESERRRAADHRSQEIRSELGQRLSGYRDKLEYFRAELVADKSGETSGWYKGVRRLYRETDRPPTSYSPELAAFGIQRLLEDLEPALKDSGKTTKALSNRIQKSKDEWHDIYVMSSKEYDKYVPGSLTSSGYFSRMTQICDKIKDYLDHGALAQWIDEPLIGEQ